MKSVFELSRRINKFERSHYRSVGDDLQLVHLYIDATILVGHGWFYNSLYNSRSYGGVFRTL